MRKKKRRWPKIAAMVLVLTLLLSAVSLVLVEKFAPDQEYLPASVVSLPSRAVSLLLKPLQGVFSWATAAAVDYLQRVKLRQTLEIEYNKLKNENDDLIFKALLVDELQRQLDEWQNMEAKTSVEVKKLNPVRAQVIARETGNWFQTFTLDIGARHGVQTGMAVVTVDGLVGQITNVSDETSEVLSIIDSRSSIAGLIESSRDQGVVQGTLGIDDEPTCRMFYLPVDLVPRPNDVVVTSGIGIAFPKGLLIGTVRESTRYLDQNKHYFVIEPAVDFKHIETVMVLLYKAPIEEIEEGRDGQAAYSPVPLDTYRPPKTVGDQINDPNLGGIQMPLRPERDVIATPRPSIDDLPDDALTESELNARYGIADPLGTPNPDLDALIAEEQAAGGGD